MTCGLQTVPATMEFVDIAGIVKGASEGAGLGNKFLANIRECDAIVHVLVLASAFYVLLRWDLRL